MLRPFCKPSAEGSRPGEMNGKVDGLMWYKDLGNYAHGEFSMAVIQANRVLEDQSQLECGQLSLTSSGPFGTFVGVYDGHGGPEASRFITSNLFHNIKRFASELQGISANVIKKAFMETDQDFLSLVKKQWQDKPQLASVGSCCLTGIVTNGNIYIGNAGDSRVVLGRLERATRRITPIQLSEEHNANLHSVREELWSKHPNDPQIVSLRHNVWRVKGLIQVSRSIGDAHLKRAEFNREPLPSKFRLPEAFDKPILSSEPSVSVHELQPDDQFLILASDGLWEHLTNQEAVDIVQNHQRKEISRRLIKAALQEAARKREMRYSDLKKIDKGVRRHFHDDITVIVLFLDQLDGRSSTLSVKGP